MDNLGLLSSLHFPNVLFPCSPLMYGALMMASLYGCRCLMCKKNGLKRSLTNCENSSSEEFSLSKCRRLDRCHEDDESHLEQSNNDNASHKCCAGTQTLFSSFVPVHGFYPQPPSDSGHDVTSEEEPRFILDLDHHMSRSSQIHPGIVLGGRMPSSPLSLETESSNTPLNLTLPPSSKSGLLSIGRHDDHDHDCGQWTKDQLVIGLSGDDRAPGTRVVPEGWRAVDSHRLPGSKAADLDKAKRRPSQTQQKLWPLSHDVMRPNAKAKSQSTSPRKSFSSVVTVECANDIEEHFRRSLGKDYSKRLTNTSSNTSSSSSSSSSNSSSSSIAEFLPSAVEEQHSVNVLGRHVGALEAVPANGFAVASSPEKCINRGNASISGAVDDHFAKSLGHETWTELRSQNCQTDSRLPQPGSVDDHFAKALGQETWFKLRVKKEGTT